MSVGFVGGERQIINVAAGAVSASSTDAINGSQLHATNEAIDDLSGTVIANKTKYYSVNSGATGNKNNDGAQAPNAMAMGGNASATGGQAIAIGSGESGQNTVASGQQSIAIGANVVSSGNSSIAIGGDDLDAASKVNGVNALFDTYTGSTGGLVTVGDYSNHTESNGAASVAIGVKAHSKGNLSTAVGVRSSSSGDASSAFGMGSSATKKGSVALGAGSTTLTDATYQDKLTIGSKDYLYAGETNDKGAQVSVGSEGSERQIKHVASGEVSASSTDAINGSQLHATNESVKDLSTTVVANKTHFYSVNSTDSTRGNYNNNGATGVDAIAAGVSAEAEGEQATAIGYKAKAEGDRSVALGERAQATTLTGTAIGSRTLASAVQSTAVGVGSKATKQWATATGFSSEANGISSVALGDRSVVDGKESIAIGKGNTVNGTNSIAVGTGHTIAGNNSGAFGDPNIISGSGSYAVGNNNNIANNNTFVLGNNVGTTQDNSVVLGSLSTDRAATTEAGVTINGKNYTYVGQGSATNGVMSVGFVGGERQIINVAAGAVSASSTDAINGSQLHATNEAIDDLSGTVIANKTKYYSVNSGATGNKNNDGAQAPNAMAMGGNASATGGQAIAIGSGESGQNTVASGQQSIAIGANVVSTGHSSIAIGGDDLDDASKANIDGTSVSTLNGGDVNTTFFSYTGRDLVETPRYKVNTESGGAASIAIGAKSLSEGALSTAVGVQSSSSGVASSAFGIGASASEKGSVALGAGSVANVAGGAIGYDPTGNNDAAIIATQSGASYGAVSVGTGEAGGTRQIVNVAAGTNDSDAVNVSQLKVVTETANRGWDISVQGDSATASTVEPGDSVDFNSKNSNITVSKTANSNDVSFELNNNLDLGNNGSVTTGNTQVNNAGVTLYNGDNNQVALTNNGLNNGNNKITNVADGLIDDNSKDAVNGGQLFKTNNEIAKGIKFNVNNGLNRTFALGEEIKFDTDSNLITTPLSTGDGIELSLAPVMNIGTASPVQINGDTGTISGLTNRTFDSTTTYTGGQAATQEQLSGLSGTIIDKGFSITADNASLALGETEDKVKLSETVKYTSADGSIVTTVADNEIDFALGDNLNVGGAGQDGEDGVDGFIGVNGADGASGVAINGADGTIGLTGPAGIDGVSPTLTMRPEIRPGDVFDDDTDVTRLSYEDVDGNSHTIATLEDDGLRFSGNDNPTVGYVTRNLNKEMQIVGSKTAIGTYSSGNINTIATQDGGIEIQMADSPKFGEVVINAENTGKITGLAAGEDDTDAVNVYQLNQTNSTINQGLDFGGDSGTDVNRKLGQKLTVKGGDTINADPATKTSVLPLMAQIP
ncbi:hypothetical protein ACOBWA_06440 [Psychrobacter sp. ER1]|uniref:hypothetical protein n=1 Tax=Psychrobacter sp. ER1 TaxID=3406645 RepID=UPI003B428B5C